MYINNCIGIEMLLQTTHVIFLLISTGTTKPIEWEIGNRHSITECNQSPKKDPGRLQRTLFHNPF